MLKMFVTETFLLMDFICCGCSCCLGLKCFKLLHLYSVSAWEVPGAISSAIYFLNPFLSWLVKASQELKCD